ncbi:FHA domain-containing protein [Clostridium sp. JN-9]|uniref:FHA domain-containing protein n=1 Tax=Clostridium sp. JN-9 TaxID=2507159 RepID=UPI000FFE2229|nr:FHA domain-containing protein [Clostridium sp. JN-9]QAT41255.1 FHA domain-containing protein [Clostridium sp. JN-9]
MDLSKLSLIFKIIIIGIVYIIILTALRIMYKDVKNGGRRKIRRKTLGLEILYCETPSNLKKGGVVPIQGDITIGRKQDNLIILDDPYVSSHHLKIFHRNGEIFVEDLGSTNGTLINNKRISGTALINSGDEIKVGSTTFKVIG